MGIASGLAVFFVVWWTVLFAVLPWGIKTDPETGQIGAPTVPHLRRKFLYTTLITAVIWVIIYVVVSQPHLLSFRDAAREMPL